MKAQQTQGTTVEIVVAAPGNRPGLRICAAGGNEVTFYEGDDLRSPFPEAFGSDGDRLKRLRNRPFALILLLLLARAARDALQTIGYAPTPDGKLCVSEVGRLPQWPTYQNVMNEPKLLLQLVVDISNYFPRKLKGPVSISGGKPKLIWVELDVAAIHFAPGAIEAALAYIQGGVDVTAAAILPRPAPVHFDELPGAGEFLFGRQEELAVLDAAWASPDINVLVAVGWGGAGKSALVRHWCNALALRRGDVAFFGWSFYRQGTQHGGASADLFFDRALRTFGDPDPRSGGPLERAERLAGLIRRQRTLLVLDGVEPLQDPRVEGRLRDTGLQALLRHLSGRMNGLVIITTRPPFRELADCEGRTVRRIDLEALSTAAGIDLLKSCGVRGAEEEMRIVCQEMRGHPLTLILLGTYLVDAWKGDIQRWSEVVFPITDGEEGRHAQRIIQAYDEWYGLGPERAALRLLGLFDRPAPRSFIRALREAPIIVGVTEPLVGLGEAEWNRCLSRLQRARLIVEVDGTEALDTHPLIRAYFGAVLQQENPTGFRAAHGRLFEHLRDWGKRSPDTVNDTLAELEPLLLAVCHGCQANRLPEALALYQERVRRGERHFSVYELNAIGADLTVLMKFFDGTWCPVEALPQVQHGWLLMALGIALRALNRTNDALQPFEKAGRAYERTEQWVAAAFAIGNVVDIYIRCGELSRARELFRREEALVARSSDRFGQGLVTAHGANLYHCLGELDRARAAFAEGHSLIAGIRAHPGLYSFYEDIFFFEWYWDFVLDTEPERAKEALAERPKHATEWPFGLVYERMIHGRARAILGNIDSARNSFDDAIRILRNTGEQTWLALCLLTRAGFLIENNLPGATSDVKEALIIATVGRLRVAECEGRLLEARIAAAEGDVCVARSARDSAERLLKETGYGRRAPDVALLDVRLAFMAGDLSTARARLAHARALVREVGYGCREPEVRALETLIGT